jgi:hypothetical protein
VLEIIFGVFYFHRRFDFVFHDTIPKLGTINTAKGVKV